MRKKTFNALGRDGEIRQLNLVECIGPSGASTASLCDNKSVFTVSAVETVVNYSYRKMPALYSSKGHVSTVSRILQ